MKVIVVTVIIDVKQGHCHNVIVDVKVIVITLIIDVTDITLIVDVNVIAIMAIMDVPIITCCRGRCLAARFSRTECGWR